MKQKPTTIIRHSIDFIILFLLLGFCLTGIVYFTFDRASQVALSILLGIFYTCWGVFHHYHDNNLNISVFAEYFLMSALIVSLLVTILLRL